MYAGRGVNVYTGACKRWCWPCDEEPCFQPHRPADCEGAGTLGDTQALPGPPLEGAETNPHLSLNPVPLPQNTGAFVLRSLLAFGIAHLSWPGITLPARSWGARLSGPSFTSTPSSFPLAKWSHQETFSLSLPSYSFSRIL